MKNNIKRYIFNIENKKRKIKKSIDNNKSKEYNN